MDTLNAILTREEVYRRLVAHLQKGSRKQVWGGTTLKGDLKYDDKGLGSLTAELNELFKIKLDAKDVRGCDTVGELDDLIWKNIPLPRRTVSLTETKQRVMLLLAAKKNPDIITMSDSNTLTSLGIVESERSDLAITLAKIFGIELDEDGIKAVSTIAELILTVWNTIPDKRRT